VNRGVLIIDLRPRKPLPRRAKSASRQQQHELLWLAQGSGCFLCGGEMGPRGTAPDSSTIEHVIPRSAGGSNALGNIVLAHRSCNEAAGSRPPSKSDLAQAAEIGALAAAYGAWRNNSRRAWPAFLAPPTQEQRAEAA
jgi:5-methylcytosine-specific restriction endonuclease McrA